MKNLVAFIVMIAAPVAAYLFIWPACYSAPPLVHYDTAYLIDTYKGDTIPNGVYLPAQLPPMYSPYNARDCFPGILDDTTPRKQKSIPRKQWVSDTTPLDTNAVTVALQMLIELRHWQASNSPRLEQTCTQDVGREYIKVLHPQDPYRYYFSDSVIFIFSK